MEAAMYHDDSPGWTWIDTSFAAALIALALLVFYLARLDLS